MKTNGKQQREIDEIYNLLERQGALLMAISRQVAHLSSCVGDLLTHEGLTDEQSVATRKLVSEALFRDLNAEILENLKLFHSHDNKTRKRKGPQHPS